MEEAKVKDNNYQNVQEYVVGMRRKLHQIPERGVYLPKTQAMVCAELDKMGIPYKKNNVEFEGQVDSGIVALIEGKNKDKVIALRADMDALPILEETNAEYKSLHEGSMHACGHDIHTSMLLGAAKLLNDRKAELNGSVKLFFQTSEEIVTGAKMLIQGGAMENPKVTAVFGMHVWPLPTMAPGQVCIGEGTMMASGDRFQIHVKGKGCHGYSPERGIDPIVIAAEIITAIQKIISRETPVDEAMVISLCQVHGGTAWNIIPDVVTIEGTARTMSKEMRDFVVKRIEEISTGVAKTMRAECQVEWISGTPAVVNDAELTNIIINAAENAFGPNNVTCFEKPTMGNEDVSWFFEYAPGAFAFLNITNKEKGLDHPLHSSKFEVDEDVLWKGSALYTQTALDYLK